MADPPSLSDATALAAKLRRQQAAADSTREELRDLVVELLDRDERQVDIANATGWTRETIRKIAAARRSR